MKQLLRINAVTSKYKKKTALYDDIRDGLFTHAVRLGPKSVAWPDHEVEALMNARIAGKTADQIKALVRKLEADRKTEAVTA